MLENDRNCNDEALADRLCAPRSSETNVVDGRVVGVDKVLDCCNPTLVCWAAADKCRCVVVASGGVAVEYCLLDRKRRLLIGVEARHSGRRGRWPNWYMLVTRLPTFLSSPTVWNAGIFTAVSSALLYVELDLDILCRRIFLSGENEDCRDCHTSGAIMDADCIDRVSETSAITARALRTGKAFMAGSSTIVEGQRHQAAVCFE